MGNKDSKPDFKELSQGTNLNTKEIKAWFLKFKNDFPQGKINKEDFTRLYSKMMGAEGDAREFCDHVFRQYDVDKDGSIDFREFITTISIASKGSLEEKLLWAFNLYDIDGNHYLYPREISEMLTAIYKAKNIKNPRPTIKETVDSIFSSVDDNKDGKISEAEFVRHATSNENIKELLQVL